MARAAVLVRPRTIQVREFPLPRISADDALLKIEACGICGTEYGL
jgi:alcohol dehydrogenase